MIKELPSSVSAIPDNLTQPLSIAMPADLSELRLDNAIEVGEFGYSVYKSTLGSKPVMVKSYPMSQKQAYFNEREVYDLINQRSQKESENDFLLYYGSAESCTLSDGAALTNFVILESAENGYLSDFLKRTTISWSGLCKMLSTISQGLSYLHGFNRINGPSLCHRYRDPFLGK